MLSWHDLIELRHEKQRRYVEAGRQRDRIERVSDQLRHGQPGKMALCDVADAVVGGDQNGRIDFPLRAEVDADTRAETAPEHDDFSVVRA